MILIPLTTLLIFTGTFFYSCTSENNPVTTTPAVYKYNVLVGSRNSSSVKEYDGTSGDFLGDFIDSASGGLNTTQDLLYLSDSVLLATGLNNTTIKKYNGKTGAYIGDFSSGYNLSGPTKMSRGPDNSIYVSQWGGSHIHKIARFDINGNFIDEFTSITIFNALEHAWDENNMYVAAYRNGSDGKILKFDSTGTYQGVFINTGNILGPDGLWFGSNHHLFVADWTMGKVQEFDSLGNFIGTSISGLTHVEGFGFEPDKNILLTDWTENYVNRYDSVGNFLGQFTSSGGLSSPNCIAIRYYKAN